MEVINNTDRCRFEIHIANQISYLEYNIKFKKMILAHTEVPVELTGQGIAKALVKNALKYAEDNNYKVIAVCKFSERFLDKHQEYNHLRDGFKI